MGMALGKPKANVLVQTSQHMNINHGQSLNKNVGRLPAFDNVDTAMAALKEARAAYLILARKAAYQLARKSPTRSITIDDVRAACPPPANVDPRLMGAVFLERGVWEAMGFENSTRATCHKRAIQRFRLISV